MRLRKRSANGVHGVFVGHRASFQRGLLSATAHVKDLEVLNRRMSHQMPNALWTQVGFLMHQSVAEHVDALNQGLSRVVLLQGSACLNMMSELTEEPVSVNMAGRVLVFDATKPHAVTASKNCISLALYRTKRDICDEEAIMLRALAFPLNNVQAGGCSSPSVTLTSHEDGSLEESDESGGRVETTTTEASREDQDSECSFRLAQSVPTDVLSDAMPDFEISHALWKHGDSVVLSPTLSYHSGEEVNDQWRMGGKPDEPNQLAQAAKNAGISIPVRTMRALLTLDAKLR
eukprot:2506625-Amphidinium_carterae.1